MTPAPPPPPSAAPRPPVEQRRHALLHMWIPPTLLRRSEALHQRPLLHPLQCSVTATFHDGGGQGPYLRPSSFNRQWTELGVVSSSWVWSGGSLIGGLGCSCSAFVVGACVNLL
ncbi:hypothetical protein QJS04_geneDACA012682 [Acorus gramineus]|uniref:Uncharacterized protein n=1 Tax=Acorus gramineus TaxID=55184 RepID=A0AAV9B0G7_ACOGR|nr:hypothetical protein QJS04_geneDACA012682 [Acorus gramineus]